MIAMAKKSKLVNVDKHIVPPHWDIEKGGVTITLDLDDVVELVRLCAYQGNLTVFHEDPYNRQDLYVLPFEDTIVIHVGDDGLEED